MEVPVTRTTDKTAEVVFALEGESKPRSLVLPIDATVSDFLKKLTEDIGRADLTEVLVEDGTASLAPDQSLLEATGDAFKLLHVSTPGEISVTVACNGRNAERSFSPSTTLLRIIAWAISGEGLTLEGETSDFQLKRDEEILGPDQHLGQVARGKKAIALSLVFKVKPQG